MNNTGLLAHESETLPHTSNPPMHETTKANEIIKRRGRGRSNSDPVGNSSITLSMIGIINVEKEIMVENAIQ